MNVYFFSWLVQKVKIVTKKKGEFENISSVERS